MWPRTHGRPIIARFKENSQKGETTGLTNPASHRILASVMGKRPRQKRVEGAFVRSLNPLVSAFITLLRGVSSVSILFASHSDILKKRKGTFSDGKDARPEFCPVCQRTVGGFEPSGAPPGSATRFVNRISMDVAFDADRSWPFYR